MSRHTSTSELLHLPYFHNTFRSSEEVRDFLYYHRDRPGAYIVRPSFSKPNCLSVSVVLGQQDIRHLNIHTNASQYFLVPEVRFSSVNDLVNHYSFNPVYNEENVPGVRFLFPIRRPERRSTEPAVKEYQLLVKTPSERRNGTTNHNEDNSPRRAFSTRSEGGAFREQKEFDENAKRRSNSFSAEGQADMKRSPHDKLPHVPSLRARVPSPPNGRNKVAELPGDYSQPLPADIDLSGQLKDTLRMIEENGICDCGLRVKDSHLPDGWSIHQIKDDPASIRLFYQSPDGETAWELPDAVRQKLSDEQRANVNKLLERCAAAANTIPEH